MPYHHKVNTHHRAKRAKKVSKVAAVFVGVFALAMAWIGVDYLLTRLQNDTAVSVETSSTVQAAQINVFKTEYYRFQADSSWREVTDELTFDNSGDRKQYLYRRFDGNFIEHELFITINQPAGYTILRHNEPTRVLPVDIDAEGRIIAQEVVSDTCASIQDKENPDKTARRLEMSGVDFYCNPDKQNDFVVAIGQSGGSESLPIKTAQGLEATMTITYRNITVTPDARQLQLILSNFKIN
jgi:hypothetical protein